MASWLVRSTPNQAVWVRDLAGDILLCSWARNFILTVPFSTQNPKPSTLRPSPPKTPATNSATVNFADRLCIKRIQQNSFVDFNKDCIRKKKMEKTTFKTATFSFFTRLRIESSKFSSWWEVNSRNTLGPGFQHARPQCYR